MVSVELKPARVSPTTLVVIVHGLSRRILDTVPPVVAEALPAADILVPRYDAGPLSNADPAGIAREISDAIDSQWRQRAETGAPYQRIVLVGHSRGALLVRKAFVLACGETQELELGGFVLAAKPWHGHVERIVLLAGMNRGWSLSPRPPKMSRRRWLWLRLFAFGALVTNQARLLREIGRGAPFIANLRVQWIRLSHQRQTPLTVQILGDMDDLVSAGDNIDLQAGQDFVYLNAPAGTTHSTVVELGDAARRAVFLRALTGGDLVSEYVVPEAQRPDPTVNRVVFVMHGIRDFGGWTGRLASAIKARAGHGLNVETIQASYGYFPMGKFLLLAERQRNVRWFMDRYTEVLAKYPSVERPDFVGHSNGTYLLGSALRRYRASTFGQVVCAGSVLPRGYEWDTMAGAGRITGIRNYLASGDWVVGIFPYLFDSRGDIGGGGFLGFTREPAVSHQFEFVRGGHGAAIVDDNFTSIAAFLLDGASEPPPAAIQRRTASGFVRLCAKLNWLIWLGLLAAIVGAAWWVAFAWSPALVPYAWARTVIFVALVVAILNTI